jgi:Uma2 family endonuclease
MTLLTRAKLSFEQFLRAYPDGTGSYELINGALVEMRATRGHDQIADGLLFAFNDEIRRVGVASLPENRLSLKATNKVVIRTVDASGQEQGRVPDVSIIDRSQWDANPSAYSAFTVPIQLAVEVVSTNWEDDYLDKLDEYQRLGIVEYWIVDYLTQASRSYLGNPKVATVFVYSLVAGQYAMRAYRGDDRIESVTFPGLQLTAGQVLSGELG